jgi:hypothetical protein
MNPNIKCTRLLPMLLLGCFLWASCNRNFSDPDAFTAYVRGADYPYQQTQTKGEWKFQLRYVSPSELALKDVQANGNNSPSAETFDVARKQYDASVCFQLKISNEAQQNGAVFPEHLLLNVDGNVNLKMDDGNAVEPIFAHPERSFGLGTSALMALVFPCPANEKQKFHAQITLNEFGLETGPIQFDLDIDRNHPRLEL